MKTALTWRRFNQINIEDARCLRILISCQWGYNDVIDSSSVLVARAQIPSDTTRRDPVVRAALEANVSAKLNLNVGLSMKNSSAFSSRFCWGSLMWFLEEKRNHRREKLCQINDPACFVFIFLFLKRLQLINESLLFLYIKGFFF